MDIHNTQPLWLDVLRAHATPRIPASPPRSASCARRGASARRELLGSHTTSDFCAYRATLERLVLFTTRSVRHARPESSRCQARRRASHAKLRLSRIPRAAARPGASLAKRARDRTKGAPRASRAPLLSIASRVSAKTVRHQMSSTRSEPHALHALQGMVLTRIEHSVLAALERLIPRSVCVKIAWSRMS